MVGVRLSLRPESVLEWLALRAGLVPLPAAQAWGGHALGGVLVAAVRSGVTARLAAAPATVDDLVAELGLEPTPATLLLACLRSAGYVSAHEGRYGLTRAGRRWLDPASSTSVADFVAATGDYGRWWEELPALLRPEAANDNADAANERGDAAGGHGDAVGGHGSAATRTHATPADDPYWRRYLYGQRDLARLTATAVARAIAVRRPRAMLDLGGGHGLYAAALCRRHPGLEATVLDLPGSAAVGREIVSGLGMADRVRFVEGDVRTADLGTEYDLICCFNLVHHLAEPEVVSLFRRVRTALAPGGVFAVLDAFPEKEGTMASTDLLAMFVYLSSGARLHSPASLVGWLRSAGFNDSARRKLWGRPRPMSPRGTRLPQVPGLALYQAQA